MGDLYIQTLKGIFDPVKLLKQCTPLYHGPESRGDVVCSNRTLNE